MFSFSCHQKSGERGKKCNPKIFKSKCQQTKAWSKSFLCKTKLFLQAKHKRGCEASGAECGRRDCTAFEFKSRAEIKCFACEVKTAKALTSYVQVLCNCKCKCLECASLPALSFHISPEIRFTFESKLICLHTFNAFIYLSFSFENILVESEKSSLYYIKFKGIAFVTIKRSLQLICKPWNDKAYFNNVKTSA